MAANEPNNSMACLLQAIPNGSPAAISKSICSICQHDESTREQVVAVGSLLPLVSMLCSADLPMRIRLAAVSAIFRR